MLTVIRFLYKKGYKLIRENEISDDVVNKIFNNLDIKNDGFISYSGFIILKDFLFACTDLDKIIN